MYQTDIGQRAALRTKLLLGIAGAAVASSSAAMADQSGGTQPNKWQPYSDIGGTIGTGMTAGKLDFFVPLMQDMDQMVFANLGVGTSNRYNALLNIGLGYRTKIDSDWILGVYANRDSTELEDNNTFGQTNIGTELMSADWDVRLNGYLADSDAKTIANRYELYVHNTQIAVLQGADVGYSGFDGEVGYRVFATDSLDARVFVGGFHFTHSDAAASSLGQTFDFSYRDMSGPMARAEVTVYDIDALGSQSRLTLNGEISHDDVRGTAGYFGATLRIALGDFSGGKAAQALDEIDRRMVDPERRNDSVLTNWQYTKPEPVIIYGAHMTSQPTNTVLYVDNTLGAGSYANPTTLHDATTRASNNAFIVLTSKQGAISTTASGDGVMQAGQTIVGGGETFTVEGTTSHAKFTHDFAPGTTNPTITTTKYDNPITLASTTNLYGFSITGDFDHAVYGRNVTGVNIRDLTIDGTGGGAYGVYILRDVSGTENINISHTNISNVAYDGIEIRNHIDDGGATTENLNLDHITVNNVAYGDGIIVTDFAGFGSTIVSDVSISNATVTHVGESGIYVSAGTYGAGSIVNQTVTISGATVKYAGALGIGVYASAYGGASTTQTATVETSNVSFVGFNSLYGEGITAFAGSSGAGSVVNQTATFTNDTVSNVYGFFGGDAFDIIARARDGSATGQFVTIDPSSGTYSGIGLHLYASSYDNGYGPTAVAQVVSATGDDFSHNSYSGVYAGARGGSDTGSGSQATAYQALTLANTTVKYNGQGISVLGFATSGATATQKLTASASQIEYNTNDGIHVYGYANGVAVLTQVVTLGSGNATGDTVSYNGGNGVEMDATASGGGVYQTLTAHYAQIAYNGRDGVHVSATATSGTAQQVVGIYNSYIGSNYGNGVFANGHATGGATVIQGLNIASSRIEYNSDDGVSVSGYAGALGVLTQNLTLGTSKATADTISYNYGDGVGMDATASGGGIVYQNLRAHYAQINYNGDNGVSVYGHATSGSVKQTVGVYNSYLTHNGEDGLFVSQEADSGTGTYNSVVAQYVNLKYDTLSNNTGYGAYFRVGATGSYDAGAQHISIEYSTLDNNAGGVRAFAISYNQASANQYLYFAADDISNNAGDGVYVAGVAETQAFTRQVVDFGYKTGYETTITGNGGDGIYVGTAAFSGANTYQAVFIYDVNSSHNAGNGLTIASNASGYGFGSVSIYYSHVSQNVIAAYDTFDYNGKNGVGLRNIGYYGGVLNQLVSLYGIDASHNSGAGFYEKATMTSMRGNDFAFTTNMTSDIYLANSTFNYNGTNGIDLRSYANAPLYAPAFFGGYSYMIQHIKVTNSDARYNAGAGLVLNANQAGRYSLNAEYLTISGSNLNTNRGNGAQITSTSNYGPGGFGDTFEQVTISDSSFSYNGANGLYLAAFASGRQGRAEQHVTISGSDFDYNGADGIRIYASAINGTYIAGHPCTTVQGLAGGCAFVRQNVAVSYSYASHNGDDGINVLTYANNYGAIYGVSGRPHSPTLELTDVTADYNGLRGLNISNHVSGHSYLYQYTAAIDSHFDHNANDGIYASSYVGGASTMLQRNLLYSYHATASAAYNVIGNGFKSSIEALGGSYARDVNIVNGANTSYNGSFGIDAAVAYADGTSTGLQINAFYVDNVSHNGDGLGLYSLGAGAQQISYTGGDTITHNAFVGAYGEANFGAFQYVKIYSGGNTVTNNGTNYLFNSFGGSTQILN